MNPLNAELVPRGLESHDEFNVRHWRTAVLEAAMQFAECAPHNKTGMASARYRMEQAALAYQKALRGR